MITNSDYRPCEHCGDDILQDDGYEWVHAATWNPDCQGGETCAE